jgi:anti-sigma factor RsiW
MKTSHIDAETLEQYALGQLEEHEHAAAEEHLLTCQRCRKRLIQAIGYVEAMREALRRHDSRQGLTKAGGESE